MEHQLLAPNGQPSNLTREQYRLVRTPEFKAWFGDWENDPENASKVLDINNEPLIMWHGSNTMEKINIFQSNKGHDYSFFSNDYNEAKRYVENFYRVHPDEIKNRIAFRKYYDSKIKKFYIKAIKPFEYNKLSLDKLNQLDEFLLLHVEELHNLLMKYIEHSGMSYALYLLDLDIDPKISKFDLLKYFLQRHSDDWWILEAPVFQNYIKNNGYDAFITKESGAWNIAVYKPNQIKLADGSNTTFDGSNPDIRYAKGGEIDTENMLFWHGGDLSEYNENIAQKSGRYEYGAGLYLTTELRVATKYSKGRRRLYLIEVEKGQEISDATIPENKVHAFIDRYVIGSKKKEIKHRLEKYTDDKGRVKAGVFNNIILNEKAIQSTKTYNLREFYVENGIDYELVDNAFGWGETMMVLYNMKKIVNKKTVSEKEAYQMGSIKREDKTDDAKNTFEIGGSVEKVNCPNKITSYNQLNW